MSAPLTGKPTAVVSPTATVPAAQQCVLVIDDTQSVRELLADILHAEGYRLEFAASGPAGLGLAAAVEPDVILLDVMMPGMDGFEVCRQLRGDADLAEVPIIMITALDDRASRVNALQNMVDEYITKPFDAAELKMRIRTLMRLNRYRQLLAQRRQIEQTLSGTVQLLTELLTLTDPRAARGAEQLQKTAGALAELLAPEGAHDIKLAAMLAGIGQMTLPARIVEAKRAGHLLSEAEREIWRRIPVTGHALLQHIPNFSGIAQIVLYQQKRYDGTGYPVDALRGAALPLGARVLKLSADLLELEAMGTPRPCALDTLRARIGWYDPRVLEFALRLWEEQAAANQRLKQPRRYSFPAGVQDLREGQVLLSDVVTAEGTLLVAAGKSITETVLERIRNFARLSGVREPIEVESLLPKAS